MAASYTFWRSTQPHAAFPSPLAVGLPTPAFDDTSILPGVTYYYTMTKTDGAATTSNEASAAAPLPPGPPQGQPSMTTRIFSTGTLFIDTGAGPVEFATLQEIEWSQAFQEKELRAAPWINMFAEARAFYGGEVKLKAKNATILAAGLTAATAGVNTPAVAANPGATPPTPAVPGVVTVGRTAVLPRFSAQFTGQDESGNPFTATAQKVRCPGATLPFKLDDYVMPDFTMVADEGPDGVVLTWHFTA